MNTKPKLQIGDRILVCHEVTLYGHVCYVHVPAKVIHFDTHNRPHVEYPSGYIKMLVEHWNPYTP